MQPKRDTVFKELDVRIYAIERSQWQKLSLI
jgi:hypothetical protein